ncbi:MAG: hypothetical protein A2868_03745 [Candidatus Levybacteria bacterium RIFCSPHIGHO2_01_FULL_40_15b]|nr:MAG: hypothetical protein A2868_03745 [Candidatus Levybacteria bacterium RIFCSPHIGHO2_01_FULL_40_15b]
MSIESLLSTNPSGDEFVRLVQRKAEQMCQSRVHVFLQEFITEGRDGILSTARDLNERGIEIYRGWRASGRISQTEKMSLHINHTGILFGLSGIAVESALVERVFDINEFCGLYEESLRGTPFSSSLSPVDDGVEQLTADHWRHMIALANEDKTLAVFFEPERLDALPVTLQGVLSGMGLLPVIQQHILPEYQVRAASLVTP